MPSVIGWFYILQALPLCSWSSLFRDEAEVNVNHHFLHCWESLLAQTSLPGSLGIVPQLEEQELSPSETRALGGVLSAETPREAPARDIPSSIPREWTRLKQGMVSTLASWGLKIFSALFKSWLCNGDKWPECQGNGSREENNRLGHFVNPLDM